jgi:hypothetical protein
MKLNKILSKVYRTSSIVIVPVMLLVCLLCKWSVLMIIVAMLASIVISSPATISLHILAWLSERRKFERSFAWMVLLASIPLLSFVSAWLFADFVPGKVWSLLLLGIASGYVGILSHGISVTQIFNSNQNEREENITID